MQKIHLLLLVSLVSSISYLNGQNIAKDKKYTLSVTPNYSLTEGSDYKDLTDGFKKSERRFWQNKSTVGWRDAQEVRINLNLDDNFIIESVLINTARGIGAEVNFPLNCLVFSSSDNIQFEYHGDLMLSEDNSVGDYKVQSFKIKNLNAIGRYVTFVLKTNGKYLFLDEIEVYGSKAKEKINKNSPHLISKSDFDSYINNATNESLKIRNNIKQYEAAKFYLGNFMPTDKSLDIKKESVDNIIKAVQSEVLPQGVIFTPILSIEDLNKFNLNSAYNNQKNAYKHQMVVQKSGLHYFSLINNSSTMESILFQSSNVLDYTVYEILPVISQNRVNIKDALRPVSNNMVDLKPGENKYFVAKMFQNNNYNGNIKIFDHKQNNLIGEVVLNKKETSLAIQNGKLNVNLWAYLDKTLLKDNIQFAVNDLENAGVNTIVVHSSFLVGQTLTDFSKLKKYLSNFKNLGNKKILLFYNFSTSPKSRFKGKTFLDNTWKSNFSIWYKMMQRELSGLGVNIEEVYFYPYDEIKPNDINNYIEIVRWGKANIPNFKTFVTINNEKSYQAGKFADIVQIPMSHLNRIRRIDNKNIWVYTADNQSRELDPYKDYRLMSWHAYYFDLKGVGFWNYCNIPSVNDAYYNKVVNGNREYSVIYLDENNKVLLSLRWLCFQQGLNDYQMLKAYEKIIGKTKTRNLVKIVIDNPNDTDKADDILKKLSELL